MRIAGRPVEEKSFFFQLFFLKLKKPYLHSKLLLKEMLLPKMFIVLLLKTQRLCLHCTVCTTLFCVFSSERVKNIIFTKNKQAFDHYLTVSDEWSKM